jgi:O-Antigen ligase
MGFVLSLLYFTMYYLTPKALIGPLAAYHVELILAALIVFASVPKLRASIVLKTPQSVALIGLAIAVLLSVVIGARWIGGGIQAFFLFIPNAFGYFLVCLHFRSRGRLQILIAMLLGVCLFVIAHGAWDLRAVTHGDAPPTLEDTETTDYQRWYESWAADHPYILPMRNDAGQWFYRVRGLGEINDPNDFGQLVVCLIPLLGLLWRSKKRLWNLAFVILPICVLLAGVYLTHSRGALIALAVLLLLTARRRIGTIPAAVLTGGFFAGSVALHFTGGRDVSSTAGVDRTSLWGQSLQVLKSHPLFGVGFGNLPDYLGLTAHNSLAVCAAELGVFGLFFWTFFLFPTIRDAFIVALPSRVSDGKPVPTEETPLHGPVKNRESIDKQQVLRWGRAISISLIGFLVAGFFLSRAFVMTLFLLGGVAEVIYSLALDREMVVPRMSFSRVAAYSAILAASLLIVLYISLRIVNVTR